MSIFRKLLAGMAFSVFATSQALAITVTTSADSGPGSLRDAINQANAVVDCAINPPTVIDFNLSSTDEIKLQSGLPFVTCPVSIDGTSTDNSRVVVDGNDASPLFSAFFLAGGASGSTIENLKIINIKGDDLLGILAQVISLNFIENCIVSNNVLVPGSPFATGIIAGGFNGGHLFTDNIIHDTGGGIQLFGSPFSTISNNTIYDGFSHGIVISDAAGTTIAGNRIGIDENGNSAPHVNEQLGADNCGGPRNCGYGIYINDGAVAFIAGAALPFGSSFSTVLNNEIINNRAGLIFDNYTGFAGTFVTDVLVQGNYFGTNADQTITDAGNFGAGVFLTGASANFTLADNVIAYNGDSGVVMQPQLNVFVPTSPPGALPPPPPGFPPIVLSGMPEETAPPVNVNLTQNSIYANVGPGIDFVEDFFDDSTFFLRLYIGDGDKTKNDKLDPDVGPNNLQNFPKIKKAKFYYDRIKIKAKLKSEANKSYRVEYFLNSVKFREGRVPLPLCAHDVTTNHNGKVKFKTDCVLLPSQAHDGIWLTATASEIVDGVPRSTSEFSKPKKVKGEFEFDDDDYSSDDHGSSDEDHGDASHEYDD